ncbi:hypothetical protein IWX49DRAFT_624993 [Phyllosticta citricarpa]|uniref:Uncharacterized protein n=2 Tax=Phyllosticta TaxID=121621 RepID=A0ABR1MK32_9PEZI
MRLRSALLGGLLILGHAAAFSPTNHGLSNLIRRDFIQKEMARWMVEFLHIDPEAEQAQNPPVKRQAPQNGTNPIPQQFELDTKAACDTAMMRIAMRNVDPSGLAVCYNLPVFDNSTGRFQAELRLYNVTAPFDPWTGTEAKSISMTLSYTDATVQEQTDRNSNAAKRDVSLPLSWPPIKAKVVEVGKSLASRANGPEQIKVITYVGQINGNSITQAKTSDDLKRYLTPRVNVTARRPVDNKAVSSDLSVDKASFLTGVFSDRSAGNDTISGEQAAIVANSISFLMPGQRLAPLQVPGITIPLPLLTPVGLVVTLVWTVAFVATVTYGTYQRIRFREQYRRRLKMQQASSFSRI